MIAAAALIALYGQGPAAQIEAYLAQKIKDGTTPGVSVTVVRDRRLIYAGAAGWARVKPAVRVDADTSFRTMSLGKQFTAVGVLILVQEGRVALDASARTYLPDLPKAWKGVSIRHLLEHRSGIPSYHEMPGFTRHLGEDVDPRGLMMPVYDLPLAFPPGTASAYSNSDYFVLGMIIERISHEPLSEFLLKNVFAPLGMKRTHLEMPHEIVGDSATGYAGSATGFVEAPYVSPNVIWAAGGFVTTARDIAAWDIALHRGMLLRQEFAVQMESPSRPGAEFSLGGEIGTYHGHPTAGHEGSGIGFNTDYLVLPADHLSVVVLCNTTRAPSPEMARHIAGLCIPSLSDSGRGVVPDPDPAVTARVRRVLENASQGKTDPVDFSPSIDKGFLGFLAKAGPRMLGPLGRIRKLDLIAAENGMRRYHVQYETGSLYWDIKLDSHDLIAAMEPSKE